MVLSSDQNNRGFVDPTTLDPFLALSLFHVSFSFLGTENYHVFNYHIFKGNGGNVMKRKCYFQTTINEHTKSFFPLDDLFP